MTIAEQLYRKGVKEGKEQGVQEGLEKGMQQGMQQGIQLGIEKAQFEILSNPLKMVHLSILFPTLPDFLKVKLKKY